MREVTLTIRINKPVNQVFEFLLNSKNTPLWISSVVKEETSEWPVKVGTLYQNHGTDLVWNKYTLIELKENQSFELLKDDNNYHVHYSFKQLEHNVTEFIYSEWVEKGELSEPFTQDILEKMKAIVENK